jgi:2-phospho-L-lactate guanylyltransferase
MTCWIVTPIKAPEACKTRLGAVLGPEARRALVERMLRHVVGVAGTAEGVDRLVLLGPSRHGLPTSLELLPDDGDGLNAALARAMTTAAASGVDRLVILPADLPQLATADVEALVTLPSDHAGIAPDRAGRGTNALSLPIARAMDFNFRFGVESFSKHRAEAARMQLPLEIVRRKGLGFDVDEPEDLDRLAKLDALQHAG